MLEQCLISSFNFVIIAYLTTVDGVSKLYVLDLAAGHNVVATENGAVFDLNNEYIVRFFSLHLSRK